MAMEHGKGYYEDISDDLLYVCQMISQKISGNEFNLNDERDMIKDILKRLESQLSDWFMQIFNNNYFHLLLKFW